MSMEPHTHLGHLYGRVGILRHGSLLSILVHYFTMPMAETGETEKRRNLGWNQGLPTIDHQYTSRK